MRGPEEDKRGFHLRSPCQYLPHAGIPPLYGYSLDSASERGMTRTSPRTSMRGPEEDKRGFHLRSPCQYLPHAVFPPLCGLSPLRIFPGFRIMCGMTTYKKKELQLPEALFVARPGYDPGTFPMLYRDALTLRHNNKKHQASLQVLYELNEKELQLPEALFVARPGYDPGTS